MSKTDRVRVYYNLHKKCFSVQDYKTGLVTKHTNQLDLSNALFVVRKSGNERVKSEGRKNVHAFVNGIVNDKSSDTKNWYEVRYNPYEMDYFHYKRIVNNKPVWLQVDKHWIGNVSLKIVVENQLYTFSTKPVMYADIDKLSASSSCENQLKEKVRLLDSLPDELPKFEKFLERKIKIFENKNKIKKKTVVI
tara:strand:+ start:320 stop:895 length:576 start_codon:yes stop_codon:yes gene_type:complete